MKLNSNLCSVFEKELRNLVNTFFSELADKANLYIPPSPTPGTCYKIPKLHKVSKLVEAKLSSVDAPTDTAILSPRKLFNLAKSLKVYPPGRPIVSCIGTLTEHLSGFVDSILNPLLPTLGSYIQETTHFLRILKDIKSLPSNLLLVTMDVSALYTNIPHDEGILACKKILSLNGYSQPFINDFTAIIAFILTHNHFEFNGQHYLQTCETAIGTRMAPSYAIIFMADLENRMMAGYPMQVLHFHRYIDDIFFIWPHGLPSLHSFVSFCNTFHSSIKFTFMMFLKRRFPFLTYWLSCRTVSCQPRFTANQQTPMVT